jgi:glutamine amidotransferase
MTGAIGVIDYGMGNRRSVQKALEHVGADVRLTGDPEVLAACEGLVLPGVGAFPAGMRRLRERGLATLIAERVSAGTPLLGICLGMQLLFERSEEGETTAGLGLLAGDVTWLQAGSRRLPHIGWNEVRFERSSPLLSELPPGGCPFYHVHSLAVHPADPTDVVATCEYGERFATMVARERVFGVQFHPEKSSRHGLAMLAAFVRLSQSGPVSGPAAGHAVSAAARA